MNSKLLALLLPAFFLGRVCQGQQLSDVQATDLSAATASFQAKKLVIDNMRITSATTRPSDYVRGTFKFQNSTQSFLPKKFAVFQNVGVFTNGSANDDYFANDVPSAIRFADVSGRTYGEDQDYYVTTSGAPFSANLTVGQVLSFRVSDNTDDFRIALHAPDGTTPFEDVVQAGASIISGTTPILQSGTYTLTITPLNAGQVSLSIAFGNANRQTLRTIGDGDYISTYLRVNLHDYYKYRIRLNAGDKLYIDAPSSDDIHLVLVNSESVKVASAFGLGILFIRLYSR